MLFALKALLVLEIWFSSALRNCKTVCYKYTKFCTIFQFEKVSFCLVAILVTFRWILVNVSVHEIKISVVNFKGMETFFVPSLGFCNSYNTDLTFTIFFIVKIVLFQTMLGNKFLVFALCCLSWPSRGRMQMLWNKCIYSVMHVNE